jgi:hypothetical protein
VDNRPCVVGLILRHRTDLHPRQRIAVHPPRPTDRCAIRIPSVEPDGAGELGDNLRRLHRTLTAALRPAAVPTAMHKPAGQRVEPIPLDQESGLFRGEDELLSGVARRREVVRPPLEEVVSEAGEVETVVSVGVGSVGQSGTACRWA